MSLHDWWITPEEFFETISILCSLADMFRADDKEEGEVASDSCSENHWCYSEVKMKKAFQ